MVQKVDRTVKSSNRYLEPTCYESHIEMKQLLSRNDLTSEGHINIFKVFAHKLITSALKLKRHFRAISYFLWFPFITMWYKNQLLRLASFRQIHYSPINPGKVHSAWKHAFTERSPPPWLALTAGHWAIERVQGLITQGYISQSQAEIRGDNVSKWSCKCFKNPLFMLYSSAFGKLWHPSLPHTYLVNISLT